MSQRECPVVFATHGPGHHFFGYYDKSPLDRSEQRLLTHRADFDWKRMPRAEDRIAIGIWTMADGAYRELTTTAAYNWQQGSMLQWLGPDHESRILFNDREGDRFVSRIFDLEGREVRTLPLPVYSVSSDGRTAICVNYERIYFPRPGYNYQGVVKPFWDQPMPPGDGLSHLDLETGEHDLVLATKDVAEIDHKSSMDGATHYLEHAMFNPDGSRFSFFHCWRLLDGAIYSRLLSADPHGRDVRVILDTGMVSHQGWRGCEEMVAWGRPASAIASLRKSKNLTRFFVKPLLPAYHWVGRTFKLARGQLVGDTYLLMNDTTGAVQKLASEVAFPDNGHCTWRPGDPRWMLTDTYEDADWDRHLYLYDHQEHDFIEIGRFHTVPESCETGFRCDLHPRWGYSGNLVCIDSTHERDERQMYVIDVRGVVGGVPG